MVPHSAASSSGVDHRSLDALRNAASRDPKSAARQAAVQFEAVFTQMVLKSMREATIKTEKDGGSGGETFTSMLDSQLARQFAGRPHGLADMIERQLSRHMQNLPPISAENLAPVPPVAVHGGQGAARAAGVTHVQSSGPAAARSPVAGTSAAATAANGAAPGTTEGVQSAFIRRLLPHAQAAERETGVPASFILGQAALESGWGKGEIRHADGTPSFNLFGIKATGWTGATAEVRTTEYEDGQPVKQLAKFRSYGSYGEAFADYARMLAASPRYSGVLRSASTPEVFAGGMQRAGYATDPQYAAKLTRTISQALVIQRAIG